MFKMKSILINLELAPRQSHQVFWAECGREPEIKNDLTKNNSDLKILIQTVLTTFLLSCSVNRRNFIFELILKSFHQSNILIVV